MNKLEETKLALEKIGFDVTLTRHIRSDKTLSNVSLSARKIFNVINPASLKFEVETIKELVPEYHVISLDLNNFYQHIEFSVSWYPKDPSLNPKSTEEINLVRPICFCPEIPNE